MMMVECMVVVGESMTNGMYHKEEKENDLDV